MTIIPVMYHGDDADSHRRRSFCVASMSSPLAPPVTSWDNRVLLSVMDVSRATNETFETLDAWMVWSFCEMQEGSFFTVDPFGRSFERGKTGPVCGPYRAVLCAVKGDQKYLQRCLKLKTSWNSDQVCMYCDARYSGDLVYTSFGPGAPHRETLVDTDKFIRTKCNMNPWIRLPGFSLDMVLTDWLHLVDLAITPEVSASVIWLNITMFKTVFVSPDWFLELVGFRPQALIELTDTSQVWEADSQDERLRLACVQFVSMCRAHGVSSLDTTTVVLTTAFWNDHDIEETRAKCSVCALVFT